MPPARAIQIGIQITEALDAAHRAGLVHRDLKPSNILLTKSGVKLLDFGIAARTAAANSADATMTGRLTGAHTIVGTPQYMAPEQIEAREPDARSDIFALGCIVYEMVTGKRAFEGSSPSQIMAAILERDPRPLRELQPIAPPSLEWTVSRALAKDPDERWQDVRDVKAALLRSLDETTAASRVRAPHRLLFRLAIGGLALAIATIAVLAFLLTRAHNARPRMLVRSDLVLAEALALEPQSPAIALSPDGKLLAYVTGSSPRTKLFVRRLDDPAGTGRMIAEGAHGPFFSPDGRWIAFGDLMKGKLYRTSADGGGSPTELADLVAFRGGVWLPDDTIVFSPGTGSPLMRVAANGGPVTPFTTLNRNRNDKTHRYPDMLPDGRHVIYTAGNYDISTYEEGAIVLQSVDGGPDKVLIEHGMFGRYADGHILYTRGSTVYAVPFDAARLQITGAAAPVLSDVVTHPPYGYADLAVSANGVLVYAQGREQSYTRRLLWIDRQGRREPALPQVALYNSARLSPDGTRIVAEIGAANNELRIADLQRPDVMTRITFHADAYFGRWTPNGRRVTYMAGAAIHETAADGSGGDDVLVEAGGRGVAPSDWSPDGRMLAFQQGNAATGTDVLLYDRSTRRVSTFLATPYNEASPQFSPDGKWLAYLSDESGRLEVYLRPYGRPGGFLQVTPRGGTEFAWNPRLRGSAGGEIVFRHDDTFFAVPISLRNPPSAGEAVRLFDVPDIPGGPTFGFGLSTDGQRILLREGLTIPPVQRLAMMVNWGIENR